MLEQATETLLATEPLFIVAGIAALIGITALYLYGGFIENNYTKIKWFRRLFLPHLSALLRNVDEQYKEFDISDVHKKIETRSSEKENVFDLYLLEEDTPEEVTKAIGEKLIDNHFRPEVILASLGRDSDGEAEIGNFVLTSPEKNHPDSSGISRLYDIATLFTAKYQLHVRIFYDEDSHKLQFYAHHELNPYNPLYAKKHLNGEGLDSQKGVRMFREYKDLVEPCGVEVVK